MKNNNFDFLRFYFAFIVVIGHLIILTNIKEFSKFSPYFNTYTSVTGFFCISGFLIARSYAQSNSLKQYFLKRAARLLPAYIFVISVSTILLSFVSELPFSDYFSNTQTYKYLFSNLIFMNFIQPTLPGVFNFGYISNPINGALWTLKIEVGFYIILPFMIYFLDKAKNRLFFLIVIYFFSIIYQFTFDWLSKIHDTNFLSLLAHQLPAYLSYFISGISIHYYFDFYYQNKLKLFVIGILVLILERSFDLQILMPIALSFVIFAIAYSIKHLNTFAKYGDISYGIYIYHFPIINLAIYFGLFKILNHYLAACCVIVLIILCSYFSWHYIEKKVLVKVRKQKT